MCGSAGLAPLRAILPRGIPVMAGRQRVDAQQILLGDIDESVDLAQRGHEIRMGDVGVGRGGLGPGTNNAP